MCHVRARSHIALTSVAFFVFSSVTPCASNTTFTMNQNWFGSLFPTSLNTGNLITLTILKSGNVGGGLGEDVVEYGEISGGVGGSGTHRIHCFFKLIKLLSETFMSYSSLYQKGEIKELISILTLPSF